MVKYKELICMIKRRRIFIFFSVVILLTLSNPVFALELTYPPLGSLSLTATSTLNDYILYVLYFIILSASGIGILSIIIAGFQILLSFGKPESVNAARKRIFDAIIGIIILMSSYLILNTINPDIVRLQQASSVLVYQGVYIGIPQPGGPSQTYPTGFKYILAPQRVLNLNDPNEVTFPAGSHLYYNCYPPGDTIMLWTYDLINFGFTPSSTGGVGNPAISKVTDWPCNGFQDMGDLNSIGVKSYYWDRKSTGVYYYSDNNCQSLASCSVLIGDINCVQQSDGAIPVFSTDDNPQVVRSVKIVSSSTINTEVYGVILSKTDNFKGECTEPIIDIDLQQETLNRGNNFCFPIPLDANGEDFDPKYAYIIRSNPSPQSSGDGVIMFSNNLSRSFDGVKDPNTGTGDLGSIERNYIGAFYKFDVDAIPGPPPAPPPGSTININTLFVDYDDFDGNGVKENILTQTPYKVALVGNATEQSIKDSKECANKDPATPCLAKIAPFGNYYTIFYGENKNNPTDKRCMLLRNDPVENLKYDENNFLESYNDPTTGATTTKYELKKIFIIPSTSRAR